MQIFAHRGASGEYPENTLLAFEQAIAQGADGIELDAHFHPDGKFVLIHDRWLQTKTNGLRLIVNHPLADILALKTAGLAIPTLTLALELIAGKCQVNIELKDETSNPQQLATIIEALQRKLQLAVDQFGFNWQQFIISSFNHHLLYAIKQRLPDLKIAALIATNPLNYSDFAAPLGVFAINTSIDCLDSGFVQHAHQNHYQVWVYTVDQAEDIDKCLTLKVDGVFTNFPKQTINYVKNKQRK